MKVAKLLHNPKAGSEEHDTEKLISLIESNGFQCRYSFPEKEDGKDFETDLDFVIVAGGDGTVRQITKGLLDRTVLEKTFPIALLPLGTANNIGKTLQIDGETEEIIRSWRKGRLKKYDVGRIYGLEDATFFLESFGYGLFPYLMQEMEKVDEDLKDTPEKKYRQHWICCTK